MNLSIHANTLFLEHNIHSVILQTLTHEFKKSFQEMAAGSQMAEKEPLEGDNTEPQCLPPSPFTSSTYSGLYAIVYRRRGRINAWLRTELPP